MRCLHCDGLLWRCVMKYLKVVSLVCLLSACASTQVNTPQTPADKVAEFPSRARDLSACVHQAAEALNVPYTFRLHARPDKRAFVITAALIPMVITQREFIGLELQFLPQGEATTVEIREGVTGGWWVAPKVWPLVERCSQQHAAQPFGIPRAP